MYQIKVTTQFNSAHNLRGYKGKCEELHGHNWRVEAVVSSEDLNEIGMVADFKDLKKNLNEITSVLDHKYLNEADYFSKVNPTSENIARYIFDKLKGRMPKLKIDGVTVWETDTSSATYYEA